MSVRTRRHLAGRALVPALLTVLTLVAQPAIGEALPPPPPNPSDDDLKSGQAHVDATATRVGQLANQVAQADAALLALQDQVEIRHEQANKALINQQVEDAAAAAATLAADNARAEADAAAAQITVAHRNLDQFAAASFRQGNMVGSVSAFLGSTSPKDLLARAELLDAVGGAQLHAVEDMRRARVDAANKDSQTRAALAAAQAAKQAAADAKTALEGAYRVAIDTEAAQSAQSKALQDHKADLERQLYEAQNAVVGLRGQRQRYEEWRAERDREAAAAAAAAAAERSTPATAGGSRLIAGGVQSVINRAMAELGVRYSWGGGNAQGPTIGVRDGGVADTYGDYRRVGFDCSGLIVYAFSRVLGYSLPHYTGYQYNAGRKVPLADKRPGDLLFWSTGGDIHHVALYIGGEQMIEAPYSGAAVHVTPVRYAEIMPYAVRLL
ncbi:MAG: C40 family peptidase [Pseudonocardiales bacterium]|nr:C40 family peptidase [Pseudonocardiales bacterium]MBV9031866.1 C40 family peptidase [Pseudonocardiales bacterium]